MKLTHDIYARDLLKRFDERITGAAYSENISGYDKQDIMIGMLGAQRIKKNFGQENEYVVDLEKQYENLPSISLTFLTKKESNGSFLVSLSGDFYYRILPTYKKQKVEYLSLFNEKNGTDFESVRDAEEFRLKNELADEILFLMDVFNKMHIDNCIDKI